MRVGVLGLVVVALATYRAVRIFTDDSISHTWRAVLYRWAWCDPADPDYPRARPLLDEHNNALPISRGPVRVYLNDFATCPYCLGVWAAAVCYWLWRADVEWLRVLLVVLAIAGVQTFLQLRDED